MFEYLSAILTHIPSWPELLSAMPVIFSLILIEGLLSVDNAMAIAGLADNLPEHQQKKALRWGIVGAYGFRGLCLLFASWIAENMWIKAFGAVYLLYLMAHGLIQEEGDDDADAHHKAHMRRSLIATIIAIEIMDLSMSIDNVVAAVAIDKRLWVVCLGVFIGILALRFVAGYCITLMKRYPILKKTAFLLIGFVGLILAVEISLEHFGIHIHIDSIQKFVGVVAITGASLLYGETQIGKRVFSPMVTAGKPVIHVMNWVFGEFIIDPIKAYFTALAIPFTKIGSALWNVYRGYDKSVYQPGNDT